MAHRLSQYVKQKRKQAGLTQEDLAYKAGVGLRFVRDLEQGKQALQLDKVNQVLRLFNAQVGPVSLSVIDQLPVHHESES